MSKQSDEFHAHCDAQTQRMAVFERRGWPYNPAGQAELSKRLETIAGTDRRKLSTRARDRVTAVVDVAVDEAECPTPSRLTQIYRDLYGQPDDGKLPAGCADCAAFGGDWRLTENGMRRCSCARGQKLREMDGERGSRLDTRSRPELKTAAQIAGRQIGDAA